MIACWLPCYLGEWHPGYWCFPVICYACVNSAFVRGVVLGFVEAIGSAPVSTWACDEYVCVYRGCVDWSHGWIVTHTTLKVSASMTPQDSMLMRYSSWRLTCLKSSASCSSLGYIINQMHTKVASMIMLDINSFTGLLRYLVCFISWNINHVGFQRTHIPWDNR